MRQNLINNKSGFSVIVAILITAFLTVLSSGILILVLQENNNSSIVYNTISTYAWAEWALEYALLKVKNHRDGFQDKIVSSTWSDADRDSKLISLSWSASKKDVLLEYEMIANWTSYTWTIGSWAYEIIPLFFDSGTSMQINSKNPSLWTSDIKKTTDISVNSSSWLIWNIIGNDWSWATFWITWTWQAFNTSSSWSLKTTKDPNENTDYSIDFDIFEPNIWWFLWKYESNYLILYNPQNNDVTYNLTSNEWFSFPRINILTTASVWDYTQNISFTQNKSEIFDLLKYSFFNK